MTRCALACVLVAALLLASASVTLAGTEGDRKIPDDGTEIINGVTWTRDVRVTINSADDCFPQVAVDKYENAHVLWQRSGYWTKTFDKAGTPLTKDIFITPHVVNGYGSPDRYPLGPQFAIDGDANIHVVWDDGWQNCYYQKLDADGNTVTDVIRLGNEDSYASHVPSVAVGPDDRYVHVVHEDYEYQCEDIVYDKLDMFGRVLVNEVSVSADVSAHCEHSTLTTDHLGFVHVAFGASTGCWWRKVDSDGVARGQSVNIFGSLPYMISDLACTPNGDVHLVWTADGEVRYARLDNNGTMLDTGVAVSELGVSPGPPRIAASPEEDAVHIVWHDRRDGNYEVYYATMDEGTFGETPDNWRLTHDTGNSLYPRVAVSPEGSVHVVWQDDRDGNCEVYYKFMFPTGMTMGALSPSPDMFFFHPNETKALHLYIENQGALPDDYTVEVTPDEWAEARGWRFRFNETVFNRVPGGSMVFFNLRMWSPANATQGDYVNVTLTARSSMGDSDEATWRSFIIVERAVYLRCAEPTKRVEAGGDVRFDLTVTNTGDLPDTYRIDQTLVPDDKGWQAVQEYDTVSLAVNESADLSVVLSAPANATANAAGSVFVRVISLLDASVWDSKKLVGVVDPELLLEMDAPVPALMVDPAGRANFPIVVRNTGNHEAGVAVTVTSVEPRPGWTAVLSDGTVSLAGGEETVVTLTVIAPADALAGSRQVIRVSTVTEDLSSRSSVEVTAVVSQVHGLTVSMDQDEVAVHSGEEGVALMTVTNDGNGNEMVDLGATMLPAGWGITYEIGGVEARQLPLTAKETATVSLVVSTPWDAGAGRGVPLYAMLTDSTGRVYIVPFHLRVLQRYGVDLSAPDPRGEAAPGGTATFVLVLRNEGNGVDYLSLEHGDLPGTGWQAVFHEVGGLTVDHVTLAGGEERPVELTVLIPADADVTGPVDILARATSTGAVTDEVKLMLGVMMADLRIVSVEYDPATATGGRPTHVTVRVANAGSSPAGNVTVAMLEDGEELDRRVLTALGEGSAASVMFEWAPGPGRHTLLYRVSSDAADADLDDNELSHTRTVDGADTADSVSGYMGVAVFAAVVVAGLMVAAFVMRRRA